jgi:hypothetical protein
MIIPIISLLDGSNDFTTEEEEKTYKASVESGIMPPPDKNKSSKLRY